MIGCKVNTNHATRYAYQSVTRRSQQGTILTRYREMSTAAVVVEEQQDPFSPKTTTTKHNANPHFPRLFTPLPLHPAIGSLPNRVLMGSMHTGLEGHSIPKFIVPFLGAEETHETLHGMATYFKERAKGGVGLMVTGGISPNRAGWVGPFASKMSTVHEMEKHKIVTDAVHEVMVPSIDGEERARICMQILHAGRYAMHPFAVSASSTKAPISPFKARELSTSQVQDTIRDFVQCATLAKEAGYDGVEIMGSEGYLINQFLVNRTNHRKDQYGGDFVNRMKFAVDIVSETRQATGDDFIIIFRLSMLDLVNDGSSWDEIKLLAQAVEDAGATIINTGIGWHEARVPTIATSVPRKTFSFVTQKLRDENVVSIPLCATNRINAPHVAESVLEQNSADLVSMARPFLADPNILEKSRRGDVDDIITCIACNQACLDHAFAGKTASCLVNPRACHETEFEIVANSVPEEKRLNIGVVGAGPAGLAFATTAAEIGHNVTLLDKASEIGGQFNMAKRIPGKEEFHETIRYYKKLVNDLSKKGHLDLRLGVEVSYEDMESATSGDFKTIDKWIVATGVDPRTPSIPGLDHPNVLSYIDVLRGNAPVGERVAIIGAGGIGFDVAEFLLHHQGQDPLADEVSIKDFLKDWGVDSFHSERGGLSSGEALSAATTTTTTAAPEHRRKIFLMQRKSGKLGAGLGKTTGWIHRATLTKSNAVEMLDSVSYDQVDSNGFLHITVGKGDKATKRILEVDNIILCAGQTSKDDLEKAADGDMKQKVYKIGGAYEALELDAKRAIDMGTRLALKIEDDAVLPGLHKFRSKVGPEEKMLELIGRFVKK